MTEKNDVNLISQKGNDSFIGKPDAKNEEEIEKEHAIKTFLQREYTISHSPFEKELEFYESVRSGDIENVKKTFTPIGGSGYGILSTDELRNIKYHLVISIAMITRFCVTGGMEMENAYQLSDIYINKTDNCASVAEANLIHREMVFDFTQKMKSINKGGVFSKPIVMCFDYIYDNLHSKILLKDIADYVGLSQQYLSKLFHSEVGMTISEYINKKKITAASNMLKFSEYSAVDIGNYLNFSSHSHFIQTFKKYTGITPKEYRLKYYRANWSK